MVDVTVKQHIDAAPERVAAVMFNPAEDPRWIGGARKAEPLGSGPYGLGSRVRRTGSFFGRTFSWVTEVTEFEPGRLVRMKHVAGPFKGGVDYSISPAGAGAEVTVRNYGQSSFWVPFLATMMRRSVAGDLRRLKRLVEAGRQ
jgi:hypothetical protein